MYYLIFCIGLIAGFFINMIINKISFSISKDENKKINLFVIFISGLLFLISYFKFSLSMIFIKSIILASILIVVSFVDLRYKVIPDKLIIITLILGILFLLSKDISFSNVFLGMIAGGGILFLLALIPGTLGGGDIKFMFAVGSFLGPAKTIEAIFLAFILAACISILLLLFKLKGSKEYIAFGPFLAIGSFICFLL